MKKTVLWIIAILLIIASICIAGYPFISEYVNSFYIEDEIVSYNSRVDSMYNDNINSALMDAIQYNRELVGNVVITDPFDNNIKPDNEYENMLRVDGTDVMASIQIPKIKVDLPIYHGTSEEFLKKGVGHLSTSSLPVGGKGTHAILSGHTGYSGLKLFSDVDRLEIGDVFYITCMKNTLAYKIDQIKVVLPAETDDLQINPDNDYVTLVTCTPFGVNTHRLLVRGKRISTGEEKTKLPVVEQTESTWNKEYQKALFVGVIVLFTILFIFFIIRFIFRHFHRKEDKK